MRMLVAHIAHAALAVALFLAAPFSASASEVVTIPFKFTQTGHMMAEFSVDGGAPAKAAIDTGANHALLDARTLTAAGVALPPVYDTEVNVLGLTGFKVYPTMTAPSVSLGALSMGDIPAAIHAPNDFPGPTNILPATELGYRILDFNFPRGVLKLYDGRPQRVRSDVETVPLRNINGIWFMKVKVNSKTGWAMIDTGSNVTYLNTKFADRAAPRTKTDADVNLEGSTDGEALARTIRIRELRMGDFSMKYFRVLVADPPLFEHFGLSDDPVMVLGLDALTHFRVQIDQDKKQAHLSMPNNSRNLKYRIGPAAVGELSRR